LPQWNCACANCQAARTGRIPARTQSSVAVSADGAHWFLINASPDLPVQMEALRPREGGVGSLRSSPIEALLLTNADLDHVLGLLLLREGERLTVHATAAVRGTLVDGLRLEALLNTFCGVTWCEPTAEFSVLRLRDGSTSGLKARAIGLPGSAPRFAPNGSKIVEGHSVAWQIADETSGTRALIAPHVSAITPELDEAMNESDAVLFDGTFWSNDELQKVRTSARTAAEMGHLPVCESLRALGQGKARHKVFIHLNNTNPVLAPGSVERAKVEAAGIAIGEDGMEFEL